MDPEPVTTRIHPLLMFEGEASSAIELYQTAFHDAHVFVDRGGALYGDDGPGIPGTLKEATLVIGGLRVGLMDSAVAHPFSFTPSISLAVDCADAAEITRLTDELSQGGAVLMPLDAYWFARSFAWVTDRFGVSWQLTLR